MGGLDLLAHKVVQDNVDLLGLLALLVNVESRE